MRTTNRWMIGLLILAGLLTACSRTSAETPKEGPAAAVEQIEGTELSRVTLSEQAAERLGIETAPVIEAEVAARGLAVASLRKIVPYSAVLYATDGATYVYTSPKPQTFVRAPINVEYIEGDKAVLSDGPSVGTAVVTVGAAELFGTEFVFEER